MRLPAASDLPSGRLFYFSCADANGRVDLRLGQDADGELYLLTKRDGTIFRLSGAVPEPATWLLLSVGFLMLGGTMRSRRRRAAGATIARPGRRISRSVPFAGP